MTKTRAQALQWAHGLAEAATQRHWPGVQPFVMPPLTALAEVAAALAARPVTERVLVGAQDAHWEDAGAWTGEVSMLQVADAGARMVEIGHSERREHFGETDRRTNLKVLAALRHGLLPLLCVGESAQQRQDGQSARQVRRQVRAGLEQVGDPSRVAIAYEPVWAIGESGRPARSEEVAEVVAAIRQEIGRAPTVLYGGSVTPAGAPPLLALDGVDGLFVGRSAWQLEGYLALLDLAAAGA